MQNSNIFVNPTLIRGVNLLDNSITLNNINNNYEVTSITTSIFL